MEEYTRRLPGSPKDACAKLCGMDTNETVFGKLPIAPEKLIQELTRSWRKCSGWGNKRLTNRIFTDLKRIGLSRELKSKIVTKRRLRSLTPKRLRSYFGGNKAKTRRAFLLDFLWWRQKFGTALAVESELSARKIEGLQHDFEKLLCWKSPMKLMIVKQILRYSADEIADELSEYADKAVQQFVENECFVLFVFDRLAMRIAPFFIARLKTAMATSSSANIEQMR